MDGLTEGRIVHFVMPNGEHRPAMVVAVWGSNGCCNLQVFLDGLNDRQYNPTIALEPNQALAWVTSINPDEENKQPFSWHWIERA